MANAEFLRSWLERYGDSPEADEATRRGIERANGRAQQMPGWLLAHLHGEARPGVTPDLMTVHQELLAQRALIDGLAG